ncbi:PepSY domain-containing protein [Pseudomonas sp. CDFA 602]|uniref:PepSY-associated TM helix domain-containing protein n=1 Tax=Pseudomonas californiensis TaxID=2829823 RepID=UPI001E622A7A|nr:PepSY-associated TM helix domain-containing protein [Pseudomonas californiensis]MCD5994024.1 PepSY domain-containing protein [Pseudomonas californiensis]MCD5999473.1 PepSY domain-containing protein [Pseudomonas californiensis]
MAWLHTWIGLLFGWLLFAIFLTGTLSYFKDEITQWMQPEIPVRTLDASQNVQLAQTYLQTYAAGASRWVITLPDQRNPGLSVGWLPEGKAGQRNNFVRRLLDPQTGNEVQARDTRGGDFFYRFHYQLQMPYPWGRWLATIAAMVMFVTLITGIIIHKKIFKEFFTFRPRKGQRSWLDGHNALGVLVLPFHLMITYSSLVIFMSMVMPASILTAYGNMQAFYSEVFPGPGGVKAAGQPAPLVALAPLVRSATERWDGNHVARVIVNNPGDATATVLLTRDDKGSIVLDRGEALTFKGVTGELQSEAPERAMTLQVSGAIYGLHVGHFAEPLLRWLYFIFGIAGTAMIGTGLVMWLGKRQVKHVKSGVLPLELRLVEVLNIASMSGLMIAVAGFFWANRLLPTAFAGRADWEVSVFFTLWGVSLLHAAVRGGQRAWREQLWLGALLFAGLPVLDLLTSSGYVLGALRAGSWVLAAFDLTALATGLFLGWAAMKFKPDSARTAVVTDGLPMPVNTGEAN